MFQISNFRFQISDYGIHGGLQKRAALHTNTGSRDAARHVPTGLVALWLAVVTHKNYQLSIVNYQLNAR
jgi:hypothetical protein